MTPHTEVTADVATRQAIERFNDAVNRRDVDAVVAAMTEDCVFDCTQPPDGERYHGADQMRAFLVRLFATARERHFDVEELITAGDRATVRWVHHWVDTGGQSRPRPRRRCRPRPDGKVAEKLAYVKG